MNKLLNLLIPIIAGSILIYSCEPFEEDGIDLPSPPSASFTWNYVEGDSNSVVFQSNTPDGFIHFWDFGNGLTSNEKVDTAFYGQEGLYEVTYSVSNAGGMGTATDMVEIAETVDIPCEGILELLTGCDNQKSWAFTTQPGAVEVGPDPYSTEWFSSPEDGLQDEQYDDFYQFHVDGTFIYENNELTVDPWNGFTPVPYDPPDNAIWIYSPGTGTSGEDQIILQTCQFIGVWNSGTAYDIVELTETNLTLHAALTNEDCSTGEGFFTQRFVAQ